MIDFYDAWQYLCDCDYFRHPLHGSALSAFPASLYIEVVKVNPNNSTIEDDDFLNTKTEVWLESGEWVFFGHDYVTSHDYELDVGADTFEEAIVKLYCAVKQKEARNVDR